SILCQRFIPADAGNGFLRAADRVYISVYPRGCGERSGSVKSSPKVCRFIPADAGNGSVTPVPPHNNAVYPRGCGERDSKPKRWKLTGGLSPRMRGTAGFAPVRFPVFRFIPADA